MIAQRLLGEDLAAAAIAIDAAQIKGVLPLPLSALKATLPVFKNPANRHRAVSLTAEQFRFAFGNAIPEEESDELFESWAIPAPGKPLFEAAAANFNPHSPAKVDTDNSGRGPLLLIMGGKDHTVPEAVTKATLKQYRHSDAVTDIFEFPDRGALPDHRPRLARGRGQVPVLARRSRASEHGAPPGGTDRRGHGSEQRHRTGHHPRPGGRGGDGGGRVPDGEPRARRAGRARRRPLRAGRSDHPRRPGAARRGCRGDGGGLDVLVNNVGAVRPRLQGFLDVTDDDWDWTLTINFLAAVRTMRAAIPHLTGRPGANIVTISSVNAFLPDPGVIDYSAAKGALSNLCKSLSKELGPDIRVNTSARPGRAPTSGWVTSGVAATVARRRGRRPRRTSYAVRKPRLPGRFTHPERDRRPRSFLASDRVGEHHRQRLRHRRRPDHDAVTVRNAAFRSCGHRAREPRCPSFSMAAARLSTPRT